MTHLQQIKHIYPEALQWSWVNAQPGQVGEGIRNGRILKVALGPATEANAASIEPAGVCMRRHKPAMQSGFLIASVSELRRILLAAVSSGKGDGDDFKAELLGLAPLPADPLQRNGTQNDPTLPRSILKTDSSVSGMSPIPCFPFLIVLLS